MPIVPAAQRLIDRLGLEPHPEGGFYRETYRSEERIHRGVPAVERTACTAIYYLLAEDAYSAWHRIRSDELWHFHAGDPLNVYVLEDGGAVTTHRLGHAVEDERSTYQAMVPAGRWFAAETRRRCARLHARGLHRRAGVRIQANLRWRKAAHCWRVILHMAIDPEIGSGIVQALTGRAQHHTTFS